MTTIKNSIANIAISVFATTGVYAQDLKIECQGLLTSTSVIKTLEEQKTELYEFKDGNLYGYIPANWTKNQIKVDIPLQEKNLEPVQKYSRFIILDRELGTVFDSTKMWRTDIPIIDNLPNNFATFKGKCNKSFEQF